MVSGATDSFLVFASMRTLLGIFSSAANPPAIGLLRDYFPPSFRSTANVAYIGSVYIGGCLASASLLIVQRVGWREAYEIFGVAGIVLGIALLTVLEEPERG